MNLDIQIEVQNVWKKLGPNQALAGVSLQFQSALMHGLIGPEGAGKTTLFRILVGLLEPNKGSVNYIMNSSKTSLSEIRSQIAYMPQSQSLYADLSVLEHLKFFRDMYKLTESDFKIKKDQLLEITRLVKFQDLPAGKLSGGMYKKLGLMCALMSSPRVLLLDEPTNGVDPISRREFWELLYHLREENLLIIVATAYMDEAERCSKVHLMNEGTVIGSGDPSSLLESKKVNNFNDYFLELQ